MRNTISMTSSLGANRRTAFALAFVLLGGLPTAMAQQTWDPLHTGTGSDGPGAWDTTSNNWSNGVTDTVWVNGDTSAAIFGVGGAAGTVTLNAPITANNLTFNQPGSGDYVIAANSPATNTLTLSGATPFIMANGGSPTITAVIAGTAGLTKNGAGTLTLGAANTYTGNTTLDGGTLAYSVDNSIAALAFGPNPPAATVTTNISNLDLTNANLTATGLSVQTNSTTANTMTIGAGKTLTINGAMTLGYVDPVGGGNTLLNASGNKLVVNSSTNFFRVGLERANAAAGTDPKTTVNLSALSEFDFTATTGQFRVGAGNSQGTLTLANTTNNITADQVRVGDSGQDGGGTGGSNNNNGGLASMHLGAGANSISTNTLLIGRIKGAGVVDFASATGSLVLNGEAGGAAATDITIGSADNGGGNTGISGLLLAAHSATIQAGTVIVGRIAGGTSGGNGNITFDTGTFTIQNLQLGVNSSGTATAGGTGSFTVGGPTADSTATGIVNVNGQFFLGNRTNATSSSAPSTATLILNGGTLNTATDVLDASTTTSNASVNNTTLTVAGGTLNMSSHNIGTAAAPIKTINLTSGSLNNPGIISGRAITLGSAINITGTPTYIIGDAGTLTSSLPMLTLGSGGGLEGGGASGTTFITGDITVANGSHLSPGSSTAATTWQLSNSLTLSGGSSVKLKLSDTPGVNSDQINVNGALNLSGTIDLQIGSIGAGPHFGNTYILLSASSLTGTEANFHLIAPVGTRSTYTLLPTATTGALIQLQVGGNAPFNLTWIGNTNSNWELIGTANWQDLSHGTGAQQFFNGDAVLFDNTSTNLNDVQVVGTLLPSSVTVNATRNYKFVGAGSIAGGGLTKDGTGTLTIANNNTFGGTTVIQNGTLQIGDGGTAGSIGTGPITVASTLSYKRSDAITASNAIDGAGFVRQDGSGTLSLSGTNTFTGGLEVNSGVVRLTNAAGAGTGSITVNTGGTFIYSAVPTNPMTLAGGTVGTAATLNPIAADFTASPATNSTIYLADPQNLPTVAGTDVTEFNITGTLHGSGNITVLSNGQDAGPDGGNGFRLRGTGASDFTGRITLGNTVKGEVQVTDAAPNSPAGTGTLVLTAGTVNNGTLTGTFSELNVRNNHASGDALFGNNIELTGTGTAVINPLSTASPETSTLGNVKLGTGQRLVIGKNAAGVNTVAFQSATINGTATFAPTPSDMSFSGVANLVLGSIGESAAGSAIVMAGSKGTLTINGASTYTGPTTINSGTLQLGAPDVLPNTSKLVLAGGTFGTQGNSDTVGALSVTAPSVIDLGTGTSVLHFDDSHLESWQGPVTISNWSGNLGTGGSGDQVFFGASNTTLGANLTRIHFAGFNGATLLNSGEVVANTISQFHAGDWNADGTVNSSDIPAMLTALTDLNAYAAAGSALHSAYPFALTSDDLLNIGDVNISGSITNADIQAELDLVISLGGAGNVAAVPEPASLVLLACGSLCVLIFRARQSYCRRHSAC